VFSDICEQDGKGSLPTTNLDCASTREIEIPLTFDAEFFGLLRGDVSQLDTLQAREEKALTDEIVELGREVTKVTNPNRSRQHDLDRWRELFDLYLQAGVFFSTTELDRGSRESSVARMQLQWFDSEVQGRGLVKAFRLPASRNAFVRFMNVNLALLRSLKFQEINQLAITKILKSTSLLTIRAIVRSYRIRV
jgi:E3 ubiquitin-protein ligase BAH